MEEREGGTAKKVVWEEVRRRFWILKRDNRKLVNICIINDLIIKSRKRF